LNTSTTSNLSNTSTTSSLDLYGAIASAETGSESDPWIRTKFAPPKGSTAYGPCQLTRSLAEDYLNKRASLFTKEEKEYLQRFIEQGKLFAKFGKEPNLAGYQKKYDYGGKGHLRSAFNKRLYKQVVTKMLGDIYTRHEGNLESTWIEWRFGSRAVGNPLFKDDRFRNTFLTYLKGDQNGKR